MASLVVAEKPSVARDIAKVLKIRNKSEGCIKGNRVWVTWCVGHLVEQCEPQEYNPAWKKWTPGDLPMLPEEFKLRPIKRNAKQFNLVKKLMKSREIEDVINACDAGREGELIFRLVYDLAGCRKPVRRLWLSSMTEDAIQDAFRNLRPGSEFDALGDAARCRSEADWLVGMNATRALTLLNRRSGGQVMMSVGRVQTPTLAMLVEREEEIEAFVPEPFWEVYGTFKAEKGEYEGKWFKGRDDRLAKQEEAEAIRAAIEGGTGKVVKVQHKKVRERPPLLFDLTQLQRQANRRYGLSAQVTLDTAQALYEKHKLLTYPRTDSNYLTSDMKQGLPRCLQGVEVGPWAPFCRHLLDNLPLKVTRRIVNDKEVGDHHAIIPTGRRPDPHKLTDIERKVLDLVVRRFIAVFYPDAVFATTRIETQVDPHRFLTTGRVRLEEGWQAVEPPAQRRGGSSSGRSSGSSKRSRGGKKEAQAPDLPDVKRGEQVPVVKSRVHQGMTQPPRRYSESALLGAMERAGKGLEDDELRRAMKESGLGTPATRASTIETLLRRDYIQRKGKQLVPTVQGRALVNALPVDVLKSAQLTGEWEHKLSKIAAGEVTRGSFMTEVRSMLGEVVPEVLGASPIPQPGIEERALGRCPVCRTLVLEQYKAYSCQSGRDCSFVIWKTIAGRKISPKLVQVLLAKRVSKVLKGFKSKKGKKFSASLALTDEGKVEFRFDNSPRESGGHASSRSSGARGSASQGSASRGSGAQVARGGEVGRGGGAATASASPAPEAKPAADTTRETLGDEPIPCPACGDGVIIRGNRGWGCTGWRGGCRFVIWFELRGKELPDDEVDRLLRKGRTRMMNGFEDHDGRSVRARLALDLESDDRVRLELSKTSQGGRKKEAPRSPAAT